MKEKLAKLIDVKSIMTLSLTIVFCTLALMGTVTATAFLSIFTMIVGFYFGTQAEKKTGQVTAVAAEPVATLRSGPAIPTGATPESTMDSLYPPDSNKV